MVKYPYPIALLYTMAVQIVMSIVDREVDLIIKTKLTSGSVSTNG
jgi:hypothetical protein